MDRESLKAKYEDLKAQALEAYNLKDHYHKLWVELHRKQGTARQELANMCTHEDYRVEVNEYTGQYYVGYEDTWTDVDKICNTCDSCFDHRTIIKTN